MAFHIVAVCLISCQSSPVLDEKLIAQKLTLPQSGASTAVAIYRFEAISIAIRRSYLRIVRDAADPTRGRIDANAHFRARAYRLLTHYVDSGFSDAFRWILAIEHELPKKTRISLDQNPFHWGLLAMTAVVEGTFLTRNNLRILGASMNRAHAQGKTEAEFEQFHRTDSRARHREESEDHNNRKKVSSASAEFDWPEEMKINVRGPTIRSAASRRRAAARRRAR